jgi:hypothetical protein
MIMEPQSLNLSEYRAYVRRRKIELGMPEFDTAEMTEALRNKGLDRTPEKREALRAMKERAEKAGVEPIPAHF